MSAPTSRILWHPAELVRICKEAIVQGVMGQEELVRLLRYVVKLTRVGISVSEIIDCLFDRWLVERGEDDDTDIHGKMDRLGEEIVARAEEEL